MKKFAIFGQKYNDTTGEILKEVISILKVNQIEFIIEENFANSIQDFNLENVNTFSNHSEIDNSITIFISIGGDGTILKAVTYVRDKNIPIVGINAGRLGFLATIKKEQIAYFLPKIINNEYEISQRSLLELSYGSNNSEFLDPNFALNEITVSRKERTSMITIATYLNGEYLNSYWADGLIIATPTGSTGYSLSCGGPVLIPEVKSLVITPIAPHNLNARPLVVPDDTEIELRVSGREMEYLVSLDSRIISVSNETSMRIKKTNFSINMVSLKEESFLATIREKLLWGQDKRN